PVGRSRPGTGQGACVSPSDLWSHPIDSHRIRRRMTRAGWVVWSGQTGYRNVRRRCPPGNRRCRHLVESRTRISSRNINYFLRTLQERSSMTTTKLSELTGDYVLDTAHSRIGFQARHAMVTKVRGQFDDFEGGAHLDGDDPAKSSAHLTIQAKSI